MTQGIANVCHIAISGDCCEILTITVAVINADTCPKCCIVRKSLENSTHPILEMVKAAVSSALLLLMGSFGNVARNVSNATLSICVSISVWHGQEVKCHRWWVTDPPWPPVVRFSFFLKILSRCWQHFGCFQQKSFGRWGPALPRSSFTVERDAAVEWRNNKNNKRREGEGEEEEEEGGGRMDEKEEEGRGIERTRRGRRDLRSFPVRSSRVRNSATSWSFFQSF